MDILTERRMNLSDQEIWDLCSDLPPVVYSKDDVILEKPYPTRPNGDALGVAPDGRHSPEDRLLDSNVAVASAWPMQASKPAQAEGGSKKT